MNIRRAVYILAGSGAFWGTDALFLPFTFLVPPWVWIVAKTVLLPLSVAVTHRAMKRRALPQRLAPASAYLMLAGIWITGPIYALLVGRVYFKTATSPGEALFHIVLFPLTTIVISTYSGALGGLIIASIVLVCSGLFTLDGE